MGLRKKKKIRRQAEKVDWGLGLLDSALKALSKRKKRPKVGGGLAGGIKPSPCGRCD